jgi:molecular chaperone DnaK (HSP70)
VRRTKDGNHSLQKDNLIQDSEGNEENRYPVPDLNKTMINDTKGPQNAHKNSLEEEILQEIMENFMEKIIYVINKNVKDALKKYQDTKNKEHKKTQKQINELRATLNKHHNEMENIKNRYMN